MCHQSRLNLHELLVSAEEILDSLQWLFLPFVGKRWVFTVCATSPRALLPIQLFTIQPARRLFRLSVAFQLHGS